MQPLKFFFQLFVNKHKGFHRATHVAVTTVNDFIDSRFAMIQNEFGRRVGHRQIFK
jgi:hypothetical protein